MNPDDIAYRKSVRNMSVVLALIVITVFAALFVPPYLFPAHDSFQSSVSLGSPQGFTLNLTVNTTSLAVSGHVNISAWAANGPGSSLNVTYSQAWSVDRRSLYPVACVPSWPIGVGVMLGHYDQYNYSLGTFIGSLQGGQKCVASPSPAYFDFFPHSSRALVDINGTPSFWNMGTSLTFGGRGSLTGLPGVGQDRLPPGVYTVVAADEWGDVLVTNFQVAT